MILLRSFLSGHIRIKRTREYYDAGIGPNVPFGAIGLSPVVSQNFLTNTAVPSWMDVSATTGNRMLYDSTGKLTYAPNNLNTNSNTFSSWGLFSSGGASNPVVTPSYAAGPDGAVGGASRIYMDTGATPGAISQLSATSSITSVADTIISIWMKSNTGSSQTVLILASNGGISTVTVTTAWQQFYYKAPATVGNSTFRLRATNGTTSNVVDVVASYSQCEAVTYQTTPSTYVATTSAAYYGPRFDYDPSTLAAKGLLIEESRINLCTNSDNFGTSYSLGGLLAFGSGSTLNADTSPDGTVTADLITEDTSAGLHRIYKTITSTANTAYAISLYAKRASGTRNIYLTVGVGADLIFAKYNLGNGTVITSGNAGTGTLSSASIEAVGNGYYRLKVAGIISTTGTAIIPQIQLSNTANTTADVSYTGDGTSGVYLFGLQYEAGSFATSYIPTTTASVTRAADILKLTGTALTTLQGAAGTLLEEATILGNKAAAQYGVYGNTVSPLYWDSLVVKATNGTNVLSSAQTAVVGTAGRGGLAWNASGRAISFSGSAAVTDANSYGTIGATVYLGSNNGANSLNGWVRALSFYNQRLSNATLATKTTVGGPL